MIYKSKTICLEKHFPVVMSLSSCCRYIKEALIISLGVYTEQFYFDSETHHSYFDIPIPFDSYMYT